jgi:pentatricopeptide repeat protein
MGCPGPKPKSSLLCLRYTTLLKGHFAAGDLASAWRIVEEMQAMPSVTVRPLGFVNLSEIM